jgi:hypothetical protein
MIISLPRALFFCLDVSNTFAHAQSSPRFRQLSPPLSGFSAALKPPLDAVHDTATRLLGRILPHLPPTLCIVALHRVHREPAPGYKRAPEPSYPLTPLSSPSPQPPLHPLTSPVLARERCSTALAACSPEKHHHCRGSHVHGEQMGLALDVLFPLSLHHSAHCRCVILTHRFASARFAEDRRAGR